MSQPSYVKKFENVAHQKPLGKKRTTTPVSFRVTDDEHRRLKKNAGNLSLSAFLKFTLSLAGCK